MSDRVPSLDLADKPFSASLSGSVDGLSFSARLDCLATRSDGEMGEFVLTFTEPESLSGFILRRSSDGSVTVRLGELTPPPNTLLDGMLVPAEVLLEEWETASAVKTDTGYEITGECDGGRATFAFGEGDLPNAVSGEYRGRRFNIRIMPLE